MKIGIIAFGFIPGGTGGTESYFRNLISGLQKYDKYNQYTLIVRKEYLDEARNMVFARNWTVMGLRTNYSAIGRVLRKLRIINNDIAEALASTINKINFDLVHFPMQTVYPYGLKAKKVLTFHDMQEKHYPEFFSKEELSFRKHNYERSADESDRIITISNYTKNDIKEYYSAKDYAKCTTVYHGIRKYQETTSKHKKKDDYKYFYYPAATWPHKNHERLIEAFAKVAKNYPGYRLVLTGLQRQKSESINKLIKKLCIKDLVIIKGYLPYKDLQEVFNNAYALVFPSLFEGFGLPVLEAMSKGVPVLCSNTTSIPEVAGKAAIYFNPLKVKEITKAMEEIITDKKLRHNLVRKGLLQSSKFTIKNMIEGTLKVYKDAYNEK